MKRVKLLALLTLFGGAVLAQNKFEQDRAAIKALAGFYKVTFNYAETFSPDNDYDFHDRYRSSAKEIAILVEDSPKKIVIQHLLVLRGDTSIIKHWREDWTYEDPKILVFDKDDTWKSVTLKSEEYKGKWTQKVYQVDDSPRYESIGTWVHVDGRSQWISNADAPLPRREHSKRNDYNVLNRRNLVYLTPTGWMFEQDNKKIVRTPEGDKLLAQEKGLEEFIKIDPQSFQYAQQWWEKNGAFWKEVRSAWEEAFNNNTVIKLAPKVDGRLLYRRLFSAGTQSVKENWSAQKSKKEITKIINAYLIKG